MATFTVKDEKFYLNGKEFPVFSGAIHYFRLPREPWHDRLLTLKEWGFNTVETYVPWNLHEKTEGEFDFSGNSDLSAFLDEAANLGLYAIVRPGPYICAEWEAGGFPAWLFAKDGLKLRCDSEPYFSTLARYIAAVADVLRSKLVTHGGNVLMMQVENEYGAYGNDHVYMDKLYRTYRENGLDCVLFTADGANDWMFSGGTHPECLPTVTFGSEPEKNFRRVEKYLTGKPKMCAEFWCGWFDAWGEEHHTRTAANIIENIEPFFANGWNFNFYMFHGGTNFGFMNGANCDGAYKPTTTSYDYGALLTEAGDRTEAYYKVRQLFMRYGYPVPQLSAKDSKKAAYGKVVFTRKADLFDNLNNIGYTVTNRYPMTMEECGQNYGYILYTSKCSAIDWTATVEQLHDRAIVWLDGVKTATIERAKQEDTFPVRTVDKEETEIRLLVENMGRVNYGSHIYDKKGITGVALVNMQHLFGWEMHCLPMDDLDKLAFTEKSTLCTDNPTFLCGEFSVGEPCDTFVEIVGGKKGFVTVNGFNLGRYFNMSTPQKTLYVPSAILKKGVNEIVIFESDGTNDAVYAEFSDVPKLS